MHHLIKQPLTPKIDVRGAVVRLRHNVPEILLVQELTDGGRWSLPGGWADVLATPSEMVVRELHEETGYEVRALRLIGVYSRQRRTRLEGPCLLLDFLCEIVGGSPQTSYETGLCDFFALDVLPELSLRRIQPERLQNAVAHFLDASRPTDFD